MGASVIESIFDDLRKRDNVSWNIAQLTFMANLRVLKMQDMGQLLSAADTQSQKELYDTIQKQNWLMSNMGIQLMDAADSMESHQYSFSGISDVYQQFMMDISGAAQIPATKLYGRSPAGMNATGESDLQNYYDMIGQEQEAKLRPILNKLLPPLCMSVFGAVPDDLDFEFDPVSEPSDQERSDLAKSGTENVVTALNAGLVSKRTALKELKQQSERTGVWTNITDEDILKASDEIEEEGEMGGFPGMEDMMGGGGEEKRPPQMPPEKPPQMPKQTQDSAEDTGWRTLTNGVKVYIENGIISKGPKDLINKKLSDIIGTESNPSDAPMTWVDAPTFYPQTYTRGHDKHHMEHAKEMGLTFKEWLKEASDTLDSGDKDIVKWMDGCWYMALNTKNNRLAVGTVDGEVKTYFILEKSRRRYYIPKEIEDYYDLE